MKWIGWFLAVVCVGSYFGINQSGREEIIEARQRVEAQVEKEREKINNAYAARQKSQAAAETAIKQREERIETHSGSKTEADSAVTEEKAAIADLKAKISELESSVSAITQDQNETAGSLKETEAAIPQVEQTFALLIKHIPNVTERKK